MTYYIDDIKSEVRTFIDNGRNSSEFIFLGRGEFSSVYKFQGLAIKISEDQSLHNPNNYSREQFRIITRKILKEELTTHNHLYPSPILPNPFYIFDHNEFTIIVRECGIIDLMEGEESKFLPKWNPMAINIIEYQKFVDEIYRIAKTHGYFEDLLQIAKRDNGSLFIYDLGYFNSNLQEHDLVFRYWYLAHKIGILNQQLGLTPQLPLFVIEDHIEYYTKEFNERATRISKDYANKTIGNQLPKWNKYREEYLSGKESSFSFR